MRITPDQLAELEKKLSSVQNPTYSVAELCSFDELVNQLMPALIAAARELHKHQDPEHATFADYEEALADVRSLARDLDVAMHGEEEAAPQASLCDLIHPALVLRKDRDQWKARAEKAESSIQDLVKAKGRYNTQLAYEKLALSSSAPPGCDFPDPPIDGAPTA